MLVLITIVTFVLASSLVFYLQYAFLRRKNPLSERLADLEKSNPFRAYAESAVLAQRETNIERVFQPLSRLMPRSPSEVGSTTRKLMQAGYRHKSAVTIFYGIKVAFILVLLAAAFLTGRFRSGPIENTFITLLACVGAGYILPDFILSTRVTARKEKIQLALPDALDFGWLMFTVSGPE